MQNYKISPTYTNFTTTTYLKSGLILNKLKNKNSQILLLKEIAHTCVNFYT